MTLPAILAGAPLTPDRDTARRWALDELADADYARARPGPAQQAIEWVLRTLEDLLADLPGNPSTAGAVVAGVIALLALGLLAWLVARPRAGSRIHVATGGVFGGTVLTADEHRQRSRDAAAEARWREAVQEAFRGLARGLEERAVLDVRPGRTADEIARETARAFPDLSGDLAEAARAFDDVTYGGRPGSRQGYETVAGADTRLGRSRPGALVAG